MITFIVLKDIDVINWKVIPQWCFVSSVCYDTRQLVSHEIFDADSMNNIKVKIYQAKTLLGKSF